MGQRRLAMSGSKKCFKCSETKPLLDFYKHKAMADGHLGKCKSCTKLDSRKNRKENIDYYRQYDLDRAKDPERKALAAEVTKRWREQDARRSACHSAVRRAILSGLIKKENCSVCGSRKSLAHHESYSEPLKIVWYCQVCHKERHSIMDKSGINP